MRQEGCLQLGLTQLQRLVGKEKEIEWKVRSKSWSNFWSLGFHHLKMIDLSRSDWLVCKTKPVKRLMYKSEN